MVILTRPDRKSLIESLAKKFHSGGVDHLKVVGHFERYTPLYHFVLAEPNNEEFIFITELFGGVETHLGPMKGVRRQYHGNYEGLSRVIVQGISDNIIVPNKYLKLIVTPSFRLEQDKERLTKQSKESFDNALLYIQEVLRFTLPGTQKESVYPETFSSTFYSV